MITERDHNKIWITPNVINELGCNLLRDIHLGIEKVEVEHIQGNDVTPSTPIDDNASFRYDSHDGKEMSVLKGDELDKALEVIQDVVPNHIDFDIVNYAQVIVYRTDTCFPPHKDLADDNDYATAIFTLNDNYLGGKFTVEPGITIDRNMGTMVAFNNSTEVWHSVEPVYHGERWVFAVWFGREHD